MGGKRIIVDHRHALRQHKAFAVMVIVLLLVVVAVWFIQIRVMVRNVDLSQVQQDVVDAQASLQSAFEGADDGQLDDGAAAAAVMVGDAVAEAQAALAADEQVRAEVAARAAAALIEETAGEGEVAPSLSAEDTITE